MTAEPTLSDKQRADNFRQAAHILGSVWARELKAAWAGTIVKVAALKDAAP